MSEPEEPKSPPIAAVIGLLLVLTGIVLIVVAAWRASPEAGMATLGGLLCLFGVAALSG